MTENTEFLSAEVRSEEVDIYLDGKGIDQLISDLKRLKKAGDHTHYMSDKWGVGTLSVKQHNKDYKVAHHLQFIRID